MRLANGGTVVVDHVIVTSGHTANQADDVDTSLDPYPVGAYVDTIPTAATVAVSGMGLVALDVVTALTVGRGGGFVEDGGGLRYRPSGREPRLQLFCRSGLPFTAKSVTGKDRTDVYKPVICTDEALDALSGRANGSRRLVDVRRGAAAAAVRRDVRALLRTGRFPGLRDRRRRRRGARAAAVGMG